MPEQQYMTKLTGPIIPGTKTSVLSINWGNELSEQQCSMGDDKVALMDVNTEHDSVVKRTMIGLDPLPRNTALMVCVSTRETHSRGLHLSCRPPECSA